MTRTPRRDARGRFLPKRRRNPDLQGSVYGDPPEFHPYRNSPGYSPAKAGEETGKKRRPRQLALTGLPRMTTVEARRVQARERHARLVEHKRAHEEARGQRASKLLTKRRVAAAARARERAAAQELATVIRQLDAAQHRVSEIDRAMKTNKNRALRGQLAAAIRDYQMLAGRAARLQEGIA